MAIVVDGSLDLKGHARSDAEERLKERILDGYALGWRTLHVVVGSSAELRQMVLDLLMSPAGRCVARYAQAPCPWAGPGLDPLFPGTRHSRKLGASKSADEHYNFPNLPGENLMHQRKRLVL